MLPDGAPLRQRLRHTNYRVRREMQRTTSQREPSKIALVDRPIEMPLVVTGPWTREARERAAAREAHQAFIRYFRKALKVRNWVPWDDLPLAEMRERGHLLSEDTVTIIQAYLGVE